MFGKETYIRRRAVLRELLKDQSGILLFIGNVDSPAQYLNNCYNFRQDSCWLYYFGLDEPRFAATIDLDSGEETIYADDVDIDDIIWTGPMPSVAEMAASVGVSKTAPYSGLDKAIAAARAKGRTVHFLPASRMYNAVKLADLTGMKPEDVLSKGKNGCEKASEAFVRAVIEMRLVKDEQEIRELDAVGDLGYQMHTIARRGIRPGRVEQEIVGEMEALALSKGWGVSFPTILTQHGEIFHCHSHAAEIEPGHLMVIDAGVESLNHYASDHTRTYPTAGRFTPRQRDIYQTVYECNELAYGMTSPGITYREVHDAVLCKMLGNLCDLGLVKGDPAEMVADGIGGLFLPHGLGHNMGLDVHDMEDLGENLVGYSKNQKRSSQLGTGSLRMAKTLKAGNVITDEPGIYFIPALIRKWKSEGKGSGCINYSKLENYFDFGGIRLEDDVLVTAEGARRIGYRRLPISPDDVESAMNNE